ncbi:hypothetical protein TI39_contig53g00017 [Zymoseptoria brevis]|uniref:Uncharacterized protein n=1 Tax=Zymoseptoria brevis TaxID=1047168 RepID=A0A0F4GYF4_9PEZI|nr:hypothetical protein TI39_contig53g00017 [Zymoseptoria brevis]
MATAMPTAIEVPSTSPQLTKPQLDSLAKSAIQQLEAGKNVFQVIAGVTTVFGGDDDKAQVLLESLEEQGQITKREADLFKRSMKWWEYLLCFSCGAGGGVDICGRYCHP